MTDSNWPAIDESAVSSTTDELRATRLRSSPPARRNASATAGWPSTGAPASTSSQNAVVSTNPPSVASPAPSARARAAALPPARSTLRARASPRDTTMGGRRAEAPSSGAWTPFTCGSAAEVIAASHAHGRGRATTFGPGFVPWHGPGHPEWLNRRRDPRRRHRRCARRPLLGRRHRLRAARLHPHPQRVGGVRREWDEAGHMAQATDLLRDWCQRHVDEHLDGGQGRGAAARRPHAAAPRRRAPRPASGGRRRHRAALRPPRQAAAVLGLARGPRPVGAGRRRRPPLRPGRRRRRLLDVRGDHGPRGGAGGRRRARPLRRADRGQRGVGQPRPARPPRCARRPPRRARRSSSPSTRGAATGTGCGSPRPCGASST